jgi:hypothetical protein
LVARPTPHELDVALWTMAAPDFTAAAIEEPIARVPATTLSLTHATLDAEAGDGCSALSTTGVSPSVDVRLADGEALAYRADGDGELVIWVARLADVGEDRLMRVLVDAGQSYLLRPPDLAEPHSSWLLRIHPPPGAVRWQLCLVSGG